MRAKIKVWSMTSCFIVQESKYIVVRSTVAAILWSGKEDKTLLFQYS